MRRALNESINLAIMENEKSVTDWSLYDLAWELYWFCDLFNIIFFKDEPVPIPAISFESTKISTLGHYVLGRNSFGIRENININRKHLNRPMWDILATLLHELCHSWQNMYGSPSNSWFHNKEFRTKLSGMGIFCNEKGCHTGVGDPFVHILRQHAVNFNLKKTENGNLKIPPQPKKKGKSKLQKWSCKCTNVRVAVKNFNAICLNCESQFKLAE